MRAFTLFTLLLPLALATPSLLHRRSDPSNGTTSSECGIAYNTDASAIGRVWIYNQVHQDKGDLGDGLLDNLNGDCGQKNIKHWTGADPLGASGYHVGFEMDSGAPRGCVESAINKAEGKSIVCTLTSWYCLDNLPSQGCLTF